jgi:acetyl esterase/lipase
MGAAPSVYAPDAAVVPLWPAAAPGEKDDRGGEKDITPHKPGAPARTEVIRLTGVSKPTISVYKPAPDKDTGACVVVCPGGGYNILAWDLEGTEVCEWLNSIGVTGILLKYRVPGRPTAAYRAPFQDAQRALRLVRANAAAWKLDAARVGILGFSAGGHLSALASTGWRQNTYEKVDAADDLSCRPDFTILIYPAYLAEKDDLKSVSRELAVGPETPPAFIVITHDDPVQVENVYTYAMALHAAKVSTELHIYPSGGHGYGLRLKGTPLAHWPQRAAEWMESRGLLKHR